MTSESETPRIIELHVRMDCNGCVHKIRKTLSGMEGIGEIHIDQANHKVTVVGIADPETIVKAIRKTKKVPTICSHTDPTAEVQPPEPPVEGEATPPPADPLADPPADASPFAEVAPEETAPENKEVPPAETPATDTNVIRMAHDYPYRQYVDREQWENHLNMHGIRYGVAPYYATYSYSNGPSPCISEYGHMSSPVHDYNPTTTQLPGGKEMEARSLQCSAMRTLMHAT